MIYKLDIPQEIANEIADYKKIGNLSSFNKIIGFLEELKLHPRTGTGKPEQLKYGLRKYWSRRINHEDRLIYSINDNIVLVEIISVSGHYGKK
jgi:toxin YoeB